MSQTTLFRRQRAARRSRPVKTRLQVERLEDRTLMSFTNVLVNDPSADLTAQDTQSETTLVLGAGNRVVVAFNDSGSNANGAPKFAGWSLSRDGGDRFTDQGTLPSTPDDGADPVLARSSSTGTIFLAILNPNDAFNGPRERINIYRSTDNGATFNPPVNGAPGFIAGVDSNSTVCPA